MERPTPSRYVFYGLVLILLGAAVPSTAPAGFVGWLGLASGACFLLMAVSMAAGSTRNLKVCGDCAELIPSTATRCRSCGGEQPDGAPRKKRSTTRTEP